MVCEAALGGTIDEGIVANGSQGGFRRTAVDQEAARGRHDREASATLRCYREGLLGGVPFISDPSLIALRVGALATLP